MFNWMHDGAQLEASHMSNKQFARHALLREWLPFLVLTVCCGPETMIT